MDACAPYIHPVSEPWPAVVGRYKEIAFALKGVEWRQPGLVAVASKIAASAGEHKPIAFDVPNSYEPKTGANPWRQPKLTAEVEDMLRKFDFDRNFIVSVDELHTLLVRTEPSLTKRQSQNVYEEMVAAGYDTDGDGKVSKCTERLWHSLHLCDGRQTSIPTCASCPTRPALESRSAGSFPWRRSPQYG